MRHSLRTGLSAGPEAWGRQECLCQCSRCKNLSVETLLPALASVTLEMEDTRSTELKAKWTQSAGVQYKVFLPHFKTVWLFAKTPEQGKSSLLWKPHSTHYIWLLQCRLQALGNQLLGNHKTGLFPIPFWRGLFGWQCWLHLCMYAGGVAVLGDSGLHSNWPGSGTVHRPLLSPTTDSIHMGSREASANLWNCVHTCVLWLGRKTGFAHLQSL